MEQEKKNWEIQKENRERLWAKQAARQKVIDDERERGIQKRRSRRKRENPDD